MFGEQYLDTGVALRGKGGAPVGLDVFLHQPEPPVHLFLVGTVDYYGIEADTLRGKTNQSRGQQGK